MGRISEFKPYLEEKFQTNLKLLVLVGRDQERISLMVYRIFGINQLVITNGICQIFLWLVGHSVVTLSWLAGTSNRGSSPSDSPPRMRPCTTHCNALADHDGDADIQDGDDLFGNLALNPKTKLCSFTAGRLIAALLNFRMINISDDSGCHSAPAITRCLCLVLLCCSTLASLSVCNHRFGNSDNDACRPF